MRSRPAPTVKLVMVNRPGPEKMANIVENTAHGTDTENVIQCRVKAAALFEGVGEGGKVLRKVGCETHQGELECWLVVWKGKLPISYNNIFIIIIIVYAQLENDIS